MWKKNVFAVAAVFLCWSVLDFVIHGMILSGVYLKTAHLWRPMEEMNMGLMYLAGIVSAACFVAVYSVFVRPKSLLTGLAYGCIFGLGTGFSMGYGTYAIMPVPHYLAAVWFLGTVAETSVAGLLTGWIVKDGTRESYTIVSTK